MKLLRKLGLSETAEIMITVIACLFPALLAAGLLVSRFLYPFERPLPYTVGLAAGTLLSMVKVVLLERALDRAVDLDAKVMAQGYAMLQAALRYLLTIALFLCVFFFRDIVGLFGAILGVLALQLSAHITNPVLRRREKSRGGPVAE